MFALERCPLGARAGAGDVGKETWERRRGKGDVGKEDVGKETWERRRGKGDVGKEIYICE